VKTVLHAKDIRKYFPTKKTGRYIKAVDGISFSIVENEVVGLVGESGSGKSTTAYMVMGMHSISGGELSFCGSDISMPAEKRGLSLKRDMQIVFQDPGTSLNPQRKTGDIIATPLKVHNIVPRHEIEAQVVELLDMVGLPPETIHKYPKALGGGERQLVAIARAISTNPSLLVLDEPTSALDVSIQAKIINMLMGLQRKLGMSYLFITHDMSLMRNIADRIAIMYLGRIMEMAPIVDFFSNPRHPYTRMLLSSIPVVLESEKSVLPNKVPSKGEIPSPVDIPAGCRFHTRCPYATGICFEIEPVTREISERHTVTCHFCE